MFYLRPIALNLGEANQLPREFRLFVAGWNETEKGRFLFDGVAAQAVMAAYEAWGIGLVIDLEHQMLDDRPQPDPTARDARGAGRLELRNGELWAVDVKWTPDGAERLTQKRQRFVSPAFQVDPETKRITKIMNVAITALPATHQTPALVAAGARMNPDLVKQALDALMAGDSEKCMEILKGAIEAAASGASEEPAAPAEASATEETAAAPAGEQPAAPAEEEKKTMAAAAARLIRLAAKTNLADALVEIETWKASHLAQEAERQRIADENKALESAERRRLCADLVILGAEFPATMWVDPVSKVKEPKSRWASMPIAELRAHVSEQRLARRGNSASQPTPPAGNAPAGDGSKTFTTKLGVVTLTASELKACADEKADPQNYAENKAAMTKARTGR